MEGKDKSCRQEAWLLAQKLFVLPPQFSNLLNFLTSAHTGFMITAISQRLLHNIYVLSAQNSHRSPRSLGGGRTAQRIWTTLVKKGIRERQLVKTLASQKEHFKKILTYIRSLKHSAIVKLVFDISQKRKTCHTDFHSSQEHRVPTFPPLINSLSTVYIPPTHFSKLDW